MAVNSVWVQIVLPAAATSAEARMPLFVADPTTAVAVDFVLMDVLPVAAAWVFAVGRGLVAVRGVVAAAAGVALTLADAAADAAASGALAALGAAAPAPLAAASRATVLGVLLASPCSGLACSVPPPQACSRLQALRNKIRLEAR
ncbi:hypothetical protein PFX98_14055 [Paucibacter sediminis]|uniref:Uncharacterized protein n=1 Tax=Paucibacter sediminis TaxID=3019553 RepID=A0AA95N9T5_9BURK|nr:hypothetical protein [Paucibacter sp. S2-9]WIT10059.1 hypothetical protein PFX98_14055 [Paucibacter sp. S2-9]